MEQFVVNEILAIGLAQMCVNSDGDESVTWQQCC